MGGIIYGIFGVETAYSLIFVLYLIAIALIINVKYEHIQKASIEQKENIFASIKQGIKFVFNNQILLGAFSLDMFGVLFGGATALLPVFAVDILNAGPEALGLLRASPAIGAIIMSVYLTFHPPINKSGYRLLYSVAGFGLCIIAFAISRNIYLSALFLILSGSFDNVSVVIRSSILQLSAPDEMRGRIASVNSIFIGSSNEIGSFESGLAARILGLVPSVIFGGSMTLVVVLIAAIKAPKLRKLSLKELYKGK